MKDEYVIPLRQINLGNFMSNTSGTWKMFDRDGDKNYYGRAPIIKPDTISDSGSRYWFNGNLIIRESTHWGVVGTCLWNLNKLDIQQQLNENNYMTRNGIKIVGSIRLYELKDLKHVRQGLNYYMHINKMNKKRIVRNEEILKEMKNER